jgi:hypothetical protein
MQTVSDEDGDRYLLCKQSSESSLVRDPETGEEQYLPNESLTTESAAPLAAAADGIDTATRRAVLACRNEEALGLLVDLTDRGATAAETLVDAYDLCESDLVGILTEFRAAGLVRETTVVGRPGYEPTPEAEAVVDRLR